MKVIIISRFLAVSFLSSMVLVSASSANLVISEVDLLTDKVELVNTGTNTVDASGWYWCNRVNGSPFYPTVASSTIDTNLSTATSLSAIGPGQLLVLQVTAGLLPDLNGELGLYNSNSFSSQAALEDYVLWGGSGVRDSVAAGKGIWIDNDFIDVSGMSSGESLQLKRGLPGNQAADYEILPESLGRNQAFLPSFVTLSVAETTGLGFLSESGEVYRLEATPDLVNTNSWQDLGTTVLGTGGTNYFFDPNEAAGLSTQRFYRIIVE